MTIIRKIWGERLTEHKKAKASTLGQAIHMEQATPSLVPPIELAENA